MSLRWKKEKAETGLAAVCAPPRGFEYHDSGKLYAVVSPVCNPFMSVAKGWYWVAGWSSGIPNKNTCNELCKTPEEAKLQAQEYVKSHLKQSI